MLVPLARLLALAVTLALGACGGGSDDPAAVDDGVAGIFVVEGDGQSATSATTLPEALTVRVTNAAGQPLRGQVVHFVVTAGNGNLFTPSAATDANGLARTIWTLGPRSPESQQLEARIVGSDGRPLTATFSADALPVAVWDIRIPSGASQSGFQGQALTQPVVFQVLDGDGQPAAGITVSFTADAGGTADPATATTGADGLASVVWTLGLPITTQNLTATAGTVRGTANASARQAPPGAATAITLESGNGQTVTQHRTLPVPLVVRVRDAIGNGVPDVPVTFAAAAGSGPMPSVTVTTSALPADVAGYARFAGGLHAAGLQVIEATVAGLPPVTFTIDVTATPHRFDGRYDCTFVEQTTRRLLLVLDVIEGVVSGPLLDQYQTLTATLDSVDGSISGVRFGSISGTSLVFRGALSVDAQERGSGSGTFEFNNGNGFPIPGDWTCTRL